MLCRKNYRDLTFSERDRFVQALYHVKSTGVVDQFANDHDTYFHQAHHSSHFLPWHREFLRRFEEALRTYHTDVSIPYWNSTVDQATNDPLWDNNFLGQFDAAWSLNRALGSDTLPPAGNVTTALGHGTFDALWPYVEGNALHNPPHRWVAGVMTTAASPHDPVFYLHHCWIDLIWAQWQLLHPGAAFVESEPGRGLNDAMAPWSTTPADVLNHRTFNLYHYPPGMQPDPPAVTLPNPAVNFLHVPEGETRLGAAVFDLDACEAVTLTVTNGPTLVSGPPGTVFAVAPPPIISNPAVDAKARVWFTYRGTAAGDSASAAATVHCSETTEDFAIMLTADTIARPSAAVTMVLDTSNSMTFDSGIGAGITRADVLRYSAPPATVVADDANAMAVCSFDHDARPGIGMTPLVGLGKLQVNAAIAAYAPNPNGWTSIGEGVAFAHGILDPVTGYDVKAMVVLTDGQENHGPHSRRYISDVADLISGLNGHVYAIGLGRAEVLRPEALRSLCSGNNGYMVMTGDLNASTYFRISKYYQQIFAGVTNNEIVLDPEGWIGPGQVHRIPFWMNETDLSAKCILLTPWPQVLSFALETPDGDIIQANTLHPQVTFELGEQVALYRIGLPLPLGANTAHTGRWHVLLKIDGKRVGGVESHVAFVPRPNAAAGVSSHGLRYCLNVHAYSNLRMKVGVSQTSNEPGATVTVRAMLSEYGVPIAVRARCQAEMTKPDNSTAVLAMPEIEPGVFEATFVAALQGVYQLRIVAQGRTLRAHPFTREQTRTASVWRGGDDRPPNSKDDPNGRDERFCKLIHCVLSQKGVLEALHKAGIDPDGLRKCLDEYCHKAPPGQPPKRPGIDLAGRLKQLLPNKQVFDAVLRELAKEQLM
jgi:hypothetical protein